MTLIINARRAEYDPSECRTMTVGELISRLSEFDDDMPVVLGHDIQYERSGDTYWYTYGGIGMNDFYEVDESEEE